jgi:hypothetical protein
LELPESLRRNPPGNPEVRAMFPNYFTWFRKDWQFLTRYMNPRISAQKLSNTYSTERYLTNQQGFSDSNPRADYFTMENLTYPDPKVENLLTGGMVVTGYVLNNSLVVTMMDDRHVPSLSWVMERPWFHLWAVTVDSHLKPRPFPQGLQPNGENVPIVHPLFANVASYPITTIPLIYLETWTQDFYPNPFTVYRPI